MSNNPFMKGKMIEPLSFEGNDKVADFIDNVFSNSGFNARRLGEACELYARMIDEETTVCLTLAAGGHRA